MTDMLMLPCFFHSPCGEPPAASYSSHTALSLAPFLSPHATVRQRTNTLVFLIKHGALQGEKAVMDDGRKTRRKNGLPFLCGCKSSCNALITTKVFKDHSIFKRTCRSNKVKREFNLSSLQVSFSSFLTTWSCLGPGYGQVLIYTVGKKKIWSPADFVRLPTNKEMISL